MIAGLTWGELDRLVDEDPIGLRDRAWEEIQQLRAENQRLRADLVDGVDEGRSLVDMTEVELRLLVTKLHARACTAEVERDRLSGLLRGMARRLAKHRESFHIIRRAGIWESAKVRAENKRLRGEVKELRS